MAPTDLTFTYMSEANPVVLVSDNEIEEKEAEDDLEILTWDPIQAVIDLRENLPKGWCQYPGHEKWTKEDLKLAASNVKKLTLVAKSGGKAKEMSSVIYHCGVCAYRLENTLDSSEQERPKFVEDIASSTERFWFCASNKECFQRSKNGATGFHRQSLKNNNTSNAANHAEKHGFVNPKIVSQKQVRNSE